MPHDAQTIRIRGARQHNLAGIDVEIPLGALTVITGVSGSGKSSLALDTLYAEGQRRYIETFSAYARQFLERMDRPRVGAVEGVPAAIAIDPAVTVRTSRSTVGTMTELTDFVKVIYARLGILHCTGCGRPVREDTPPAAADRVLADHPAGETALVTFPIEVPPDAGHALAAALKRDGYRRRLEGGAPVPLGDPLPEGEVWVVQDRVALAPERRSRLAEAFEMAFRRGGGRARAEVAGREPLAFDRALRCSDCELDFRRLSPGAFSFNSPLGACPECRGFGRTLGLDEDLVVPNPSLSIRGKAIKPFDSRRGRAYQRKLMAGAKAARIDPDRPWYRLTPAQRRRVFEGTAHFPGVEDLFAALETKTYKMHVRVFIARFRGYHTCEVCHGTRMKPEALAFKLGGLDIAAFYDLPASEALAAAESWRAAVPDAVAELVVDEIVSRLRYLTEVGLGYLPLSRTSRTLSGGEVERVHLTAALGSTLVNTLYVLDEPSIGLHPRDVDRLVRILTDLKRRGNTVVVVEHDPDVIRHADWVIDLGPGPGAAGGRLVYQGPPSGLLFRDDSATGRCLRRERLPTPRASEREAEPEGETAPLTVRGVTARNLKEISVTIPTGRLTCLTGVSGSGKSTLLEEVIHRGLLRARGEAGRKPGKFRTMAGHEQFFDVHLVDQAPLARTPRSNPLTYLKAFDPIRKRFAATAAAVERDLGPGDFSTNVAGGRCERCKGDGVEKVEMQFLPDAFVTCPDCGGNRYKPEVLEVEVDGRTILDVFNLTAAEALEVFADDRAVVRAFTPLVETGLGYLRLGQAINTLSGGEAQRLKIARHLGVRARGPSIFLLDEPTTGLHAEDVKALLASLMRLRDAGHTLAVIEHHLGLIAAADWVIDLGPEGGDAGGEVVAEGTPREVARKRRSITGRHLAGWFRGQALPEKAAESGAPLPPPDVMRLEGLREHNLAGFDLDVPHGKLVVVTGPSGSGKSTLAFDILFAEGQRAYVESISTYARRYIPAMPRPEADRVTGIPPAVAIEQRTSRGGGTSTVATVTEVYHYLRLLYARAGHIHCPTCDAPMERTDEAEAAARLVRDRGGRKVTLLAPVVKRRRGYHKEVMERAARRGYAKARIDGKLRSLDPTPDLSLHHEHDIDIVVRELSVPKRVTKTLREALDEAFAMGAGSVRVKAGRTETLLSRDLACPTCGTTGEDPDPRLFSFNHALGACSACSGLGTSAALAEELLVPEPRRTLKRRALEVLHGGIFSREDARGFLKRAAKALGISLHTPYEDLPAAKRRALIHGERTVFEGLIPYLMWIRDTAGRPAVDAYLGKFTSDDPCSACGGTRLRAEARAVRIGGLSIAELTARPVTEVLAILGRATLAAREAKLAANLLAEVTQRLGFMERVGLGYLSLDRRATTLSGGEAQRLRLAAQLGAELKGVLYVLDEPTIGLHPADNEKLIAVLKELRDRGNSVVVVEHDPATIRAADHVIDLGPGGGKIGGRVMAEGAPAAVRKVKDSPTGRFLRRRRKTPMRETSALENGAETLRLLGAREHNLKDVDLVVPTGALTAVTGVSGSGKSTLVRETLLRAVQKSLHRSPVRPGLHREVEGWQAFRRAAEVDQSPIGRTPASVPATYVGIMDEIRALFALTETARARGYTKARFSFNRREGSCPACSGMGRIREEMAFLPDVTLACETCEGRRFGRETLEAKFRGRSIADILAMSVEEAEDFFEDHPKIHPFLDAMERLGLGYLTLGQPSPTLSGGEAQRIKLVEELGKRNGGAALLVLDEPTTGLHPEDVDRLLAFFRTLTERGHTLVVIEHDLEVIAAADHVVDLGPGGGDAGGRIVAQGPPGALARKAPKTSKTAEYLGRLR